jgi:hypothetical protein
MSETARFKVFCLEQYKNAHCISGNEAMCLFKQYGVLDYINSYFDILHSCGGKYIVQDIDLFIQSKQAYKQSNEYVGAIRHPGADRLDTCGGEIRQ